MSTNVAFTGRRPVDGLFVALLFGCASSLPRPIPAEDAAETPNCDDCFDMEAFAKDLGFQLDNITADTVAKVDLAESDPCARPHVFHLGPTEEPPASPPCVGLDDCLDWFKTSALEIPAVDLSGRTDDEDEEATCSLELSPAASVAVTVLGKHRTEAIAAARDLLSEKRWSRKEVGAYLLGALKAQNVEDLLLSAYENGNNMAGWAIGEIGSLKSLPGLLRLLQTEDSEDHVPVLRRFGEVGVRKLLKRFLDPETTSFQLQAIERVFVRLIRGQCQHAPLAIPSLISSIGRSKACNDETVSWAIVLGEFGHKAKEAVPTLRRLSEACTEPDLTKRFEDVRYRVGDPLFIPRMVERLQDTDCSSDLTRQGCFRERYGRWAQAGDKLIAYGETAASATPVLVDLINDGAWGQKPIAAHVLAHVGDERAKGALLTALGSRDWRVTYYAAQALGRIGNETIVPLLQRVASEHWSSGVRKVAGDIVKKIRGEPEPKTERIAYGRSESHIPRIDHEPSGCGDPKTVAVQYYWRGEWLELKPSWFFEGGSRDKETGWTVVPKELRAVTPTMYDRYHGTIWLGPKFRKSPMETIVDTVTISGSGQSTDGWLVGTNGGEWGGRLLFISSSGDVDQIWDLNMTGVARWGDRLVILSGLFDGSASGPTRINYLRRTDAGWSIDPYFQLPDGPNDYRIYEDTLFLKYDEHILSVDVSGQAEFLPCRVRPE